MTSKEAMIYQLKQLKGKPLKDKIEHIVTYYRGLILGVVIALALCGFLIFHYATAKEEALNIICLNSFAGAETTDSFCQEFIQAAGIDPEKQRVRLNTSMIASDMLEKRVSGIYHRTFGASRDIDIACVFIDMKCTA